jgi:hypothetical protein
MAKGLVRYIETHISNLKEEIEATKIQLNKYRRLKHGSIVLVHFALINVASSGVRDWIATDKPTLLMYKDWRYCEEGFALDFDVLATQEDAPYNSPRYQPEYSGFNAKIEGPQRYLTNAKRRMEYISMNDLPLYIHFAHTTPLFRNLIKGVKHE